MELPISMATWPITVPDTGKIVVLALHTNGTGPPVILLHSGLGCVPQREAECGRDSGAKPVSGMDADWMGGGSGLGPDGGATAVARLTRYTQPMPRLTASSATLNG